MTYVMSDIHGEYKKYLAMLEKIDFCDEDTLYVLGDVVDRGDKPIKLLQDMMSRANVYPLMGNHDLYALTVLPKLNDELTKVSEGYSKELSEFIQEWCKDGGLSTIAGFCDLDDDERADIIDFLGEFSLYEVVDVEDNTFVLVHAGLGNFRPDKKLREYTADELLFSRPEPSEQYFDDESVYVVMGHTPTVFLNGKIEIYKNGRNIFIDCGACSSKGKLACLCLDTFEEFYV